MSRPKSLGKLLALAFTVCALLAPSAASAATVVNGDFETGNLSGWTLVNTTSKGSWFPYAGTKTPFADGGDPPFFAPPQGNWAAVTDEVEPVTAVMYQDIALEPGWTHSISATLYYLSFAPINAQPTLLTPTGGPEGPQQYRVDVIKPTAPLLTLAPEDILATLFANKFGDPQVMAPTAFSADLSALAGQTVRLRLVNAVNNSVYNAGADAISIASTPPSNVFTKGKLQLNKQNGTAKLAINVPGAGTLKVANGGKGKAPKLIKAATKNPTKAGKVWLPIKPTGTAKTKLKEKGKLAFKVKVTFTPTGGFAATKNFGGTLKLED